MLKAILDRIHKRLDVVGLSPATASARAGLSKDAIRNIERAVEQGKEAGVSTMTITKLAPVLKTNAGWLIDGIGSEDDNQIPLMGYLGAGAEVDPDFEQVPPEGLEQVHLPIQLPDDMIAFKVSGDSMLPAFKHDSIIVVYREQKRPLEAFFGEEVAVRTSDGRRFIKTIMRGRDGTVNLLSWNASPIENIQVEWVGEIFAILPPAALRKIERSDRFKVTANSAS